MCVCSRYTHIYIFILSYFKRKSTRRISRRCPVNRSRIVCPGCGLWDLSASQPTISRMGCLPSTVVPARGASESAETCSQKRSAPTNSSLFVQQLFRQVNPSSFEACFCLLRGLQVTLENCQTFKTHGLDLTTPTTRNRHRKENGALEMLL